jgi:DNA-binding response OmpR family regulator
MERQYQILVIDDNSELLNTYHQFLTQHGFQVETAQDGLDGLEKLRHGEFDVALVSLQLPRLNGLELIRRATEEEIETDMIVLSDHGTKADAVAAIKVGVKDWFEKSDLDISHFLIRVKEVAEVIPLNKIGRIVSMFPVRN